MRSLLITLIALVGGAPAAAPAAAPETAPAERPNFVSVCPYSHTAPDDPIVYPGQPGAAHSHDFLANRSTDAHSTYESLQAVATTCRRQGDTAAYWVPSLTDGGETVRPRLVRAYYLAGGKDPASIVAPPANLRVIAGPDERATRWACVGREVMGRSTRTVPSCADGTFLVMRVTFPDCWNGRDLDSADHRSHMAYSRRGQCPPSHPVAVPRLFLGVRYPGSDGGDDVALSSGGPETAHADFFNAWDQAELERLVHECLNAGVHCGVR